MEGNRKYGWLQLIVITVMLLPGCSLINPHVSWDEPPSRSSPPDGDARPGGIAGTPAPGAVVEKYSLAWSIDYAENAKKAYKNAMGNQSRLASLLGIGLIPLSAATLGLAVLDKSHTDIAWMGLGAASGYAVGSWLYSKPQQRAYVAGYNATSCAIEAILPLRYVMNNQVTIKKDLDDLYSQIADVTVAIRDVNSLLEQIPPAEKSAPAGAVLVRQANEAVKAAEGIITAAKEATAKGRILDFQTESAGMNLKEAVDRIGGQVSGVIVETGPDIQALAQIIGGLAGSYGQFVKMPEELKPAKIVGAKAEAGEGEVKEVVSSLRRGITALNDKTRTLSVATHRMTDLLNTVAASKPVETLKSCGVSAEKIAIALTVDPPGPIDLVEKAASSAGRVIQGGTAPYAVTFQGSEAEGLSVRQTEPFGPAFVVQSSAKTPAGDYTLYVSDRSGNRQFVAVRVKAAQSAGGGGGASADQAPSDLSEIVESLKTMTFDVKGFKCAVKKPAAAGNTLTMTIEIENSAGNAATQSELDGITNDDLIGAMRGKNSALKSIQKGLFSIEKKGAQLGGGKEK